MNKTMMQCFEWYLPNDRNHWKRVGKMAKDLQKAGVTSVWLPPAYKGASGVDDVGYAVYDLYDLGEFNQKHTVATKYGTKDEYLAAIKALQDNGIEVLADVVLGHRMGADEKERIFAYGDNEYDRNQEIAGKKLKGTTLWKAEDGITNEDAYGFSAFPAGRRDNNGNFYSVGDYAYFWSATQDSADYAYIMDLDYRGDYAGLQNFDKNRALSVRCLENSLVELHLGTRSATSKP